MLLSVSTEELSGLCSALNEVCHAIDIEDFEFETRLGASRAFLAELLVQLKVGPQNLEQKNLERVSAWADGGSVQAICVTAFGDPVDMNVHEAQSLVDQLVAAIHQAEETTA